MSSGAASQTHEQVAPPRYLRSLLAALDIPIESQIYSDAFAALPVTTRNALYARLWEVLSGMDLSPKHSSLSASDRQAIVEILRDTKDDLPDAFRAARP